MTFELLNLVGVPIGAFVLTMVIAKLVERAGWLSPQLRKAEDVSEMTLGNTAAHVPDLEGLLAKNLLTETAVTQELAQIDQVVTSLRERPDTVISTLSRWRSNSVGAVVERIERVGGERTAIASLLSGYLSSYHAQSTREIRRAVAEGVVEALHRIEEKRGRNENSARDDEVASASRSGSNLVH